MKDRSYINLGASGKHSASTKNIIPASKTMKKNMSVIGLTNNNGVALNSGTLTTAAASSK